MKIKPKELMGSLRSSDPALVWLTGDETLLIQEAADQVRAHWRAAGFLEREIFNVDRSFDWENFLQSIGNLSLFGDQKLIEVRLTGKLDEPGKKALARYCETSDPALRVLVTGPRIEKATLSAKWFKAIEAGNVVLQVWPINRDGLGSWLEQRLLREHIRADAEALQMLVDRVEGNLLAAMQEIEKLRLMRPVEDSAELRLDGETVARLVADNARFVPFQAVEAALMGDLPRSQKILSGLRGEAIYPLPILNAIVGELRALRPLLHKKAAGQGINAILQSSHVWFNRRPAYGNALRRLDVNAVWRLLEQARGVDQVVKGMRAGDAWEELSRLLAALAQTGTAPRSARLS